MTSPTVLTESQRAVADTVITSLAGPEAKLRDDQETAVATLATPGSRALVVQATGWGKSAVYWAATAVIRAAGGGPTLIVSPLLSLMRDQVSAAGRAGLAAATVNSANVDDWAAIERDLLSGTLDVLLVSPERLANPGFGARVLSTLAGRLGLVVIDEAHAISDWGHDFRPDYRRVSDVLQNLNPQTSVLATTATANERVTDDVAAQLGAASTDADAAATLVLRGPLARKSLHLNVVDGLSPIQRYGWVTQEMPFLPGSGIVYVLTVADADRLVAAIRSVWGDEYPVAAYTGQLPPDERHELEDALLDNRVKALVATSALGMGFDKPDLGFVVHVGAPPSPVSYYQQVGRAGRALDEAVVVLLASRLDDAIWDHFATATIPEPRRMNKVLDAMSGAGPMSVVALESETGVRRGKVELMLKQLAVDGAVERTPDGWVLTGRPWVYDAPHYEGVLAVRRREADIMRAFVRGDKCLMRLLTEALDDPAAEDCGRCSVCRGELTPGLNDKPSDETVATISAVLRRDAQEFAPRKMWPPRGSFTRSGRISPELAAEPGRVLAFADAPQWGDILAGAKQGQVSAREQLAESAVAVLRDWRQRGGVASEMIVSLDLQGGDIAADLAERLRAVGRRPGSVFPVSGGQIPGREATSGVEAAYWSEHLGAPPADVTGLAVLLVVDETSSGWPVTLAAAALREAGASAVLPLVIHQTV